MKSKLHDQAAVEKSILLSIAASNLKHKKLRTLLTLFGISIGIGSVYFLLSFGLGLQNLVTQEVIGSQSIKTVDVTSPNSSIIKIDDITSQRIKEIPQASEVGSAYYFPGSFKLNNSETDAIVYGIDSSYENLTYLNVIEGVLPNDQTNENASVAVVNVSSLKAIGLSEKANEIIGKTVKITVPLTKIDPKLGNIEQDFKIVGVLDSGSGSELFIPSSVFRTKGVPDLTQLKVGVSNVDDVSVVRTQIESYGFETTSPVDTLNEINSIFKYLNFILIGFGSIGMIIAVLGMFNTLTISLLERTKEIGLMVALGARSIDMRFLFMFEAMLMSVLGAIFGMILATIVGQITTLIMNALARGRGVQDSFALFAHPWWLIVGSLIFMLLVGFIVVYLPAKRAEKINPIDALRRE